MDRTYEQWQIPEGTDVVGADGDKVGKVVAAESSYIVVEKGFFFPTDYYIPMTAINAFDGEKVFLTVTKDEALNQGWDQQLSEPVDSTRDTTFTDTSRTNAAYEGDRFAGVQPTGLADEADMAATDTTLRDADAYNSTGADVTRGETVSVPVHEEEMSATTRPVERGEVHIDKHVVEEERSIDVPVSEERVTVTRRAVDRDTPADETAFQEDSIEIPLRSEEVSVQKRNRVVEEIDIAKDTVQRTERVTDTVRREQVDIDEASASSAYHTEGETASDR